MKWGDRERVGLEGAKQRYAKTTHLGAEDVLALVDKIVVLHEQVQVLERLCKKKALHAVPQLMRLGEVQVGVWVMR